MDGIGKRIMWLRENNENRMTQKEFCKIIGISRQYLSMLENGEREPSDVVVYSISREFGVRREWLFSGTEPKYVFDLDKSIVDGLKDMGSDSLRIMRSIAAHMTVNGIREMLTCLLDIRESVIGNVHDHPELLERNSDA